MADEKKRAWSILAQVYSKGKAWKNSFWVYDPESGWILTDDWSSVPRSVYMTYAMAKDQYFTAQITAPEGIDYRTLDVYG